MTNDIINGKEIRKTKKNEKYTYVFEDKCSGTISLFERTYGAYLKKYVEQSKVDEISIHSIDRLARNLRKLLDVIEFFHSYRVSLYIENLGMTNLLYFDPKSSNIAENVHIQNH